jgi:hypothetical protein
VQLPKGFTVLSSSNGSGMGGKIRVYRHHTLVLTKTWRSPEEMEQIRLEVAQVLNKNQTVVLKLVA